MVYSYLVATADGIPKCEFCLIVMPTLDNRETAMVAVLADLDKNISFFCQTLVHDIIIASIFI